MKRFVASCFVSRSSVDNKKPKYGALVPPRSEAWCVRQEAESRCGEEPSRLAAQASHRHVHLAVDGKALRGTGK